MNEKFFYNPNEKIWECLECGYKNHQSFFNIMGGEKLFPGISVRKSLFCPKCDSQVLEKIDSRILNENVVSAYTFATPE